MHCLVQVLQVPKVVASEDSEILLKEVLSAANERWRGVELNAVYCPLSKSDSDCPMKTVFLRVTHTRRELADVFKGKGQHKGVPVSWETKGAPTCQFCQGNDHLHYMCGWFGKAKAKGIKVNVSLGEEIHP
jgi:hypothetical protein